MKAIRNIKANLKSWWQMVSTDLLQWLNELKIKYSEAPLYNTVNIHVHCSPVITQSLFVVVFLFKFLPWASFGLRYLSLPASVCVSDCLCVCVSIMLGPHEAGVWAKHPSLKLSAPSREEPSRHLGSSYQQGVSILSPLIAYLSGLWGSSMQVMHGHPQGLFSR